MILQCSNLIAFFLFRFSILRQQVIVRYKLSLLYRGGVQDTRLEAKKKKSEAKAKNRLSEDRPTQGQGQECSRPRTKDTMRKCAPKKTLGLIV